MRLPELAVIFAVFIVVFYSGASFLMSFNINQQLPREIAEAWNKSAEQINQSSIIVQERISELNRTKDPLSSALSFVGLAFGVVNFIAMSLYTVFVGIPNAIFGAIKYVAVQLGVPAYVIQVITVLIVVIAIIKAIEFITGRQMT